MAETRQMSKEKLISIIREAKSLGVQRLKYGNVEVEFKRTFDELPTSSASEVDLKNYDEFLFDDGVTQ